MGRPKGSRHTDETRLKISEANAGRKPYQMTEEIKKKISETKKGVLHTAEHNANISASGKVGVEHHIWKGDKVSYSALHAWVRRHLGTPSECKECSFTSNNRRQFHWANISHQYKRDLDDWIRLCVKCHFAYDRNKLILTQERG